MGKCGHTRAGVMTKHATFEVSPCFVSCSLWKTYHDSGLSYSRVFHGALRRMDEYVLLVTALYLRLTNPYLHRVLTSDTRVQEAFC